jgi:uncharacterized membrane protein
MVLFAAIGVVALGFVLVVGVLAHRQRALAGGLVYVEGDADLAWWELERAQQAMAVAEQNAWKTALEQAKRREQEQEERVMAVARQLAERRAWQVAMDLAKNRPAP